MSADDSSSNSADSDADLSSDSDGDDDDDSDSSDGAESSRGDGTESDDDDDDEENENEEEGDDEDECDGLSEGDCSTLFGDDGQQLCGLNIATSECYEVVRSNGVYGRGSFDAGYSAAKKEAESTNDGLNAVVAAMGAVIGVLVLIVVGGLWWIHSARKHDEKRYEMELSQIDDIEDGAQGIDSTDSAPMLVNVGSPRSPRAATSY